MRRLSKIMVVMAALLLSVNFFSCEKEPIGSNEIQQDVNVVPSDWYYGQDIYFTLIISNGHILVCYACVTYSYDTETGFYFVSVEVEIYDLTLDASYHMSGHRDDNGVLQTTLMDENGNPVTGEFADEIINSLYQYLENNLQQNR